MCQYIHSENAIRSLGVHRPHWCHSEIGFFEIRLDIMFTNNVAIDVRVDVNQIARALHRVFFIF